MAANAVLLLLVTSLILNLNVLCLGRTAMTSVTDSKTFAEPGKPPSYTGEPQSDTGKRPISSEAGKPPSMAGKPPSDIGKPPFTKREDQKAQRIARGADPNPTSSSTHPWGQGRDGSWSPTAVADSDPTGSSTHPWDQGQTGAWSTTVIADPDFKENEMTAAGGDRKEVDQSVQVPEDSRKTLNIIGLFALTGE